MANILKHSDTCEKIILEFKKSNDDLLEIRLADDGPGFDPSQKFDGKGLESMIERAKKINGQLSILSEKGRGATLVFRVKLS